MLSGIVTAKDVIGKSEHLNQVDKVTDKGPANVVKKMMSVASVSHQMIGQ